MELIWLEDYLALSETLNFSRAAEARHVTQPAFSRRIRALEGWIGAPLFTRTTHGVALTPAGEHFHNQAEVLTRALHQLRIGAAGRLERAPVPDHRHDHEDDVQRRTRRDRRDLYFFLCHFLMIFRENNFFLSL